MSIRLRLIIAFSLCLLLACSGISAIAFFHTLRSSEEAFHALAISQLERVEERINSFMEPGIMSVKYLAGLELVKTSKGRLTSYLDTTETTTLRYENHTAHERRIYDEFIRVARSNDNYGLVFMANNDGQYAQAPEGHVKYAGYDPRKRSWYKEVMAGNREVVISSPYLTTGGGMVCSIIVKTFDTRGLALGMLGIDYSLHSLTADLDGRRILKTGYVVAIDANGRILADGHKPQNASKSAKNYSPLWSKVMSGSDGSFVGLNSEGTEKYVLTHTISSLGWKLAVVFDRAELLQTSYAVIRLLFFSSVGIFLVTLAVAAVVARSIVRPMEELVEASAIISTGEYESSAAVREDLQHKLAVRGKGETGKLAEALRSVIHTLQRRVEAAVEASRAKSGFLANMSHEIRTPLNAVIGLTHLLLQTNLTEKQKDYAAKVQISAKALLDVVNDILDFSKIEAGKITIEYIPFSFQELLREIETFFHEQSLSSAIELRMEIADDVPPLVLGDPIRLRQVLINIVGNAFKFTQHGSITISTLRREMGDGSVTVECSVADTGIGMSEEQCKSIFSAFSQADSSVTRKYGGTGLGLTISQRLVNLMDGDIAVRSIEGKGTTISFACVFGLPWAGEAGAEGADAPDDSEKGMPGQPEGETALRDRFTGRRVLLAEDNIINTQIAVELLENVGVTVLTAVNGEEALEALENNSGTGEAPIELILMDLQMPVLDGYEATRRIRQNPRYNDVPIVAMTAHAFNEEKERCLALGMAGHIAKPINVSVLYDTLGEILPARAG